MCSTFSLGIDDKPQGSGGESVATRRRVDRSDGGGTPIRAASGLKSSLRQLPDANALGGSTRSARPHPPDPRLANASLRLLARAWSRQQPGLVFLAAMLMLTGCQSWPPPLQEPTPAAAAGCIELAREFRQTVDAAGTANAMAPPLRQIPYLHINRFLAALAADIETAAQQSQWTDLLGKLGHQMRTTENARLATPWAPARMAELDRCADAFTNDPANADAGAELVEQVRQRSPIGDHYVEAKRWLGLYALFRPIYDQRIRQLHDTLRADFGAPQVIGRLVAYSLGVDGGALQSTTVSDWLSDAVADNPLRVPLLNEGQLRQLFERHAPRLTIDHAGENDFISRPFWDDHRIQFATDDPVLYTLPSFTRFGGQNLLQLNYVLWFPGREPERAADLYAGRVDGLIWRVTLDHDGEVLLYDSIHNCGCYHKFFPVSEGLRRRQTPLSREPVEIYELNGLVSDGPVRLNFSSNKHFIVGVDNTVDRPERHFRLLPYESLSMLPSDDGIRSLFDANGIVPGSERLERYLLWPTGIRNVGAMRQWGTHATGFVERQHFDDADLFERYFEVADETAD